MAKAGRFVGMGVKEYSRRIPTSVIEVHIHDNNGKADEHRHPGEGTVRFGEVAAVLRETGFGGVSTTEVAPGLHKGDPVAEWGAMPATLQKWKALTSGQP